MMNACGVLGVGPEASGEILRTALPALSTRDAPRPWRDAHMLRRGLRRLGRPAPAEPARRLRP